ncbi:hypothetical protein Tco_0089352 [Tanacetum coccineum]
MTESSQSSTITQSSTSTTPSASTLAYSLTDIYQSVSFKLSIDSSKYKLWRRIFQDMCRSAKVLDLIPVILNPLMAATAQNTNNTTIRSKGKLVHLEQPLAPLPYHVLSQAVCDAYDALLDTHNEVECLMLGSMCPELQKALENYRAYDMIQELKTMFEE